LLITKIATELNTLATSRARRYRYLQSTDVSYEVQSGEILEEYLVNLETQSCSCRLWQSWSYPCGHGLAIILSLKQDPQLYAEQFYTLASYRQVYQHTMSYPLTRDYSQPLLYQVQEDSEENSGEDSDDNVVLPPATKRPPGRPQKRHIPSQIQPLQRVVHCSRCGEAGHNKKRYTAPLT
jgi:hypothetical protein